MPKISAFMIVKNEATNLPATLRSISWVDEIIVVDAGSVDATVDIARQFTSQVYYQEWLGFGAQKNLALNYTHHEWVLSLDADEHVTPALQAEICHAIQQCHIDGYFIPRQSQFINKIVNHCGWYPDYVLRLFKRNHGHFSNSLVHETVLLTGTTAKLKNPLLHYSYRTYDDVQRKINHYAQAAALQMAASGKTAALWDAGLHSSWAWFKTYILKLGILDGYTGWEIAKMNAKINYMKYQLLRSKINSYKK